MRVARFLLGVLVDRAEERAKEQRKIEERWRERAGELEQSLPAPAERNRMLDAGVDTAQVEESISYVDLQLGGFERGEDEAKRRVLHALEGDD